MSCECENTTCLDLYVSPCAVSVDTELIADATGTWRAVYEFSGVGKQQALEYTTGDPIILSNDFNGNYRHLLKLYRPNGTLFNDRCYIMNMHALLNGGQGNIAPNIGVTVTTNLTFIIKDNPNPNAGNGTEATPYELHSGASITIITFTGKQVHEPQIYNTGNEYLVFSKTSLNKAVNGVFTRTFGNNFNDGDLITFSYEK